MTLQEFTGTSVKDRRNRRPGMAALENATTRADLSADLRRVQANPCTFFATEEARKLIESALDNLLTPLRT